MLIVMKTSVTVLQRMSIDGDILPYTFQRKCKKATLIFKWAAYQGHMKNYILEVDVTIILASTHSSLFKIIQTQI